VDDSLFEHQAALADGNIVEHAVGLGVDPTGFPVADRWEKAGGRRDWSGSLPKQKL